MSNPAWPASRGNDARKLAALAATAALLTLLCLLSGAEQAAGGGGIEPPDPPSVSGVGCIQACAGERKAAPGSKVEVRGNNLGSVTSVRFSAGDGNRIGVTPVSAEARSVKALVPEGAVTGRPRVTDDLGNADGSPEELVIVSADQIPPPGEFSLRSAVAKPRKAFFDGTADPKVRYVFEGGTTDVRVQVVRRGSGEVVREFREPAREPFVENVATWNGRDEAGRMLKRGEFRFKLGSASGATESTSEARFNLYSHKFPVRASHTYGDGFGAGRGHQGQDVFASCGTRLVAARAGEVQWKAYQGSGAGYYVVIDGRSDSHDYAYMHMKGPATVREGEFVKTGEKIGEVGSTGNSSGCHLHFEYWSDDWYNGGNALASVTRKLREWDGWS